MDKGPSSHYVLQASAHCSEIDLRCVFEAVTEGMAIMTLDGRWLRVNPAFCSITGYMPAELERPGAPVIAHPEDAAADTEALHQLLAGGLAVARRERRYVHRAGHIVWVQESISIARDQGGRPLYRIVEAVDITGRRETKGRLAPADAGCAAQESERLFELIFDQASLAISLSNAHGRYIRVNARFAEMLGYTREEIAGEPLKRFLDPGSAAEVITGRNRLLAGQAASVTSERGYLHKDGRLVWARRTVFLARNAAGEPLYFIGVADDISGAKRLAEHYRAMFENAAVGITHVDLDGMLVDCNEKFCSMLGYSRYELAGKSIRDLTHPDDYETGKVLRDQLLLGDQQRASSEKRFVRRDGRTIWARRTMSVVRDQAGQPQHVIGVVEDITEQKAAEDSLRLSEETFRATFDQASVGIVVTGLDDRFLQVNDCYCRIVGYSPEELLQMNVVDVNLPENVPQALLTRRALIDGSAAPPVRERQLRRKNGTLVWVTVAASLVRGKRGEPIHFVSVIQDITQEKLSEARYRATFDHAPVGIMHTAVAADRILSANATLAEMLGYTRDELMSMPAAELLDPGYVRADRHRYFERMLRGELQTYSSERLYRRKDGTDLWVHRTVSLVRDSSGNPDYFIRIVEDINERKLAERALQASEEQFRQLANNIPQAFWITDVRHSRTLYLSPAAEQLLGHPVTELIGRPRLLVKNVHKEDRRRVHAARRSASVDGYDETYRVVRPDGTIRWVHDRAFPVRDAAGNVYRIAGIAEDITDRRLAEERLMQLAHYDVLTSLPNRLLFYDRLRQALVQAKRNEWTVAVMLIDVDRFKNINDTLGHLVGDELLQQVSNRLMASVRAGDTVGRLGGDEFAIVLSNLATPQDGSLVAQKIMASFAAPFQLGGGAEIYVTASMGITLFPQDCTDQDSLIKNADTAMYRAKDGGRNTYRFYTPEMNARASELLGMESSLRRALDRDEFRIWYQPKVNLASGAVVGLEALLRWQHPDRGVVSPGDFMTVLEETGLIVAVGEWVIGTVCAQIDEWLRAGIDPGAVAINLSARQFADREIGPKIKRILEAHQVEPGRIEFEITESSLMVHTEESSRTLEFLAKLGVGLSIDDFGTGYSSLGYLKRFPLDALKIDRSFVRDITTSPDDATITMAVISMAHSLGLKVIAEGVETRDQIGFLAAHGCDECQGYLFSLPLPAGECGHWLLAQSEALRPEGRGRP